MDIIEINQVSIPNVKQFRNGARLSIRQLASKTGVDRTKISRWERGEGVRMIREAVLVAQQLGTDVETLFAPKPDLQDASVLR